MFLQTRQEVIRRPAGPVGWPANIPGHESYLFCLLGGQCLGARRLVVLRGVAWAQAVCAGTSCPRERQGAKGTQGGGGEQDERSVTAVPQGGRHQAHCGRHRARSQDVADRHGPGTSSLPHRNLLHAHGSFMCASRTPGTSRPAGRGGPAGAALSSPCAWPCAPRPGSRPPPRWPSRCRPAAPTAGGPHWPAARCGAPGPGRRTR